MGRLKDKIRIADGFEEIRRDVASLQSPFGKRTAKQKREMMQRASRDIRYFAETYFPHYLEKPPSIMHEELYRRYADLILYAHENQEGDKDAEAAPRGNAKSTIATLIVPAWCIAHAYRDMILIISDTEGQGKGLLQILRAELEVNERLAEDFPEIMGPGRKWAEGHILTRNNVRVRAYGRGQSLRGARHLNRRPDLVICDDLENDEAVESQEQRRKINNWFFKAVMKAGARYTVYLVVGTVLHYDSLLAKLLVRPGWSGTKWKAVIRWSDSPLWETWETIYGTPGEAKEADTFFETHRDEMLQGTEVLWPEVEDYHYLMKMKVSDGPAYFDSEKQNEPINPDDCLFPEEILYISDEEEVLGLIQSGGYRYFGVCDPSMGKNAKGDPAAILIGGLRQDGVIQIVDTVIRRIHPDLIMENIFELHKQYTTELFGIEEVQFQEFFKNTLNKESIRRGIYVPVEGIGQHTDKTLRITKLQPHLKNGVIRFRRNQRTLIDQFKYFPKADHVDGPDATEMLFQLIQRGVGGPRIRSLA